MSVSTTPWMGLVTLDTANTVYQLSTLLAAIQDSKRPSVGTPARCQYLSIQADPDGQSAKYYIGNHSGMSAGDYGIYLIATQAWQVHSMDSNLIRLDHVFLMSDTASAKMSIAFITR
jgi:hypothetical protein